MFTEFCADSESSNPKGKSLTFVEIVPADAVSLATSPGSCKWFEERADTSRKGGSLGVRGIIFVRRNELSQLLSSSDESCAPCFYFLADFSSFNFVSFLLIACLSLDLAFFSIFFLTLTDKTVALLAPFPAPSCLNLQLAPKRHFPVLF